MSIFSFWRTPMAERIYSEPPPLPADMRPASTAPPLPADMQPESTPTTPPNLGTEVLLFRIRALENMVHQKDLAIRTMSDVRQVGMLAQFNELDVEYNRLFESSAKTTQKLFDAEGTIRTLADMNSRLSTELDRYRAGGVRISAPWWRPPCPVSEPGGDGQECTCKTP